MMEIIQILPKNASREVTNNDLKRVITSIDEMQQLCSKNKFNQKAEALAHCQVEYNDPLTFYVLKNGNCIINPVIIRHTRHTIMNEERCMSYLHRKIKKVDRWNKVEIEYQELNSVVLKSRSEGISTQAFKDNPYILSEVKTMNLSGLYAKIAQHEIDHFNGINIYDYE